MSDNETFHYTYSAAQQKEIEAIRKKYAEAAAPAQSDKMEQLRRLDAGVTGKATSVSLCMGIVSTIILGTGMSLVMTDLGEKLGIEASMLSGILVGILGMVGVICAYPLYQKLLKRGRKRIAPQILKLTDELSEG